MQNCSDLIEAEIKQFWEYTDGYSVMLKYSWPRANSDGVYGVCLTSITTPNYNQSCWAFTQATNEVTNLVSYYNYNGQATDSLDLSGQTALTQTSAWNAGFNKVWSCDTVVVDATTNHVTCWRFLPDLTGDASPADDWRFSVMGGKNPEGSIATEVWRYDTGTTWTKYAVTLQGARGLIGTAIASLAMLVLSY